MLRLDEYTRDSRNAMLVQDDFVAFEPLEDDPFLLSPDRPDRDDFAFLAELGIGKPYIDAFSDVAKRNGTTLEEELLANGLVTEDAWYGAFARYLRLSFVEALDATIVVDTPTLDTQLADSRMVRLSPRDSKPYIAVVPDLETIDRLSQALAARPAIRKDLVVTTPSALREAVWQAGSERRTRQTINQLFEARPHYSARIVMEGKQGFFIGAGAAFFTICLFISAMPTLQLLHIFTSLLYLATLLFRLSPLQQAPNRETLMLLDAAQEDQLPVYTILVALHREEAVIEQLVTALDRLDWPKSRLDIKLVCEADDPMTLNAIDRLELGRHFEVVRVPPSLPRTKPKALDYALAGVRGEFVAVYDAEDRPHRSQLREAYARFRHAPDSLACLQAPLIISNAETSWITSSFSLEYSALFRRMLPMLARTRMPLPLGGTSNHFRASILKAVGAWDPYNVTEDADLGLRLYRFGHRCDVIHYPTLEDAPTELPVWMAQRARWFKGWLQTWLVMMRSPLSTARQMGWRAYLVFHLMIGGMLLSSLTHPLFLTYIAYIACMLCTGGLSGISPYQLTFFAVDTLNITASYAIFLMMGLRGMIPHERKLVGRKWLFTPLYWLMLSAAAWRAVYELRYKPFVWNKTPHKPSNKGG